MLNRITVDKKLPSDGQYGWFMYLSDDDFKAIKNPKVLNVIYKIVENLFTDSAINLGRFTMCVDTQVIVKSRCNVADSPGPSIGVKSYLSRPKKGTYAK